MEEIKLLSLDETVWSDFLIDLQKLLQIPSVEGVAVTDAPFGVEPKRALTFIVDIAKRNGLKAFIVGDAMTVVEWGTSPDYVGVLGHVDVVDAGSGWNYPPYDLTEANGKFYGRGILDNKGPILSCLFALIQLKKMGIMPKQRIRIMFGSNEESGMADIAKYLEQEQPPKYAFTPDCKYPVVYGERGIVDFTIKTTFTANEIAELVSITGEFSRSSVPDNCQITLKDGTTISATGKRSPSNAPELGENAITLISRKIVQQSLLSQPLSTYFSWIENHLHEQHYGEGLGIDFADEASGKLMLTPYKLVLIDDELHLSMSIRYPISVTTEQILTKITEQLPSRSTITINRELPAHIFNQHRSIIKKLSDIYTKITGFDGTPVTTTGATYARKMPNTFAFGPSFPGQKGIAHNSDEYMDVADLRTNYVIYLNAINQFITTNSSDDE